MPLPLPPPLPGVLVVYVTAPSADVAGSIAEQLVNSKLAACVNILPGITSVYTWKVGVTPKRVCARVCVCVDKLYTAC